MIPSESRLEPPRPRTRSPVAIARAFSSVAFHEESSQVMAACVEAVREVTGGSVRISFPTQPVPIRVGDGPDEEMELVVRFPPADGRGQVYLPKERRALPPRAQEALETQLTRIWRVLEERETQTVELDRLRFHLA
ncbi:MAG: hypothetical protein M3483_06295, partial [Gemmatimonadota bacterium]|nr:hypothetical protein [Gemmatimonadota bacterium]